ncbi:MAG: GspH/FimT family pseudopilin [bacterium]
MKRLRYGHGFTLVELIVVMGVLATVLALSAPRLSRFFHGRTIEEEARRVLALTRYARSEAISRSAPMELWIDIRLGEYGLAPQMGYEFEDMKLVEFKLADNLQFDIGSQTTNKNGQVFILFLPDGAIDEESLLYLLIRQDMEELIEIEQADYGMGYVIRDQEYDEQKNYRG